MPRILYFAEGSLIGIGQNWWHFRDFDPLPSQSIVFICPVCGGAWGRVIQEETSHHLPIRQACKKHVWLDQATSSGSFIMPWRKTFDELPPEVLSYEFHRLLNLPATHWK